jgi:hypothetical protein
MVDGRRENNHYKNTILFYDFFVINVFAYNMEMNNTTVATRENNRYTVWDFRFLLK